MSERAVRAYCEGEMPKSKWTKAAMLSAIEDYCAGSGIPYDGSAADYRKKDLFDIFFEWKSWHHTGKYANVTDFYGLNEEAVCAAYDGGE